MWEDYYREIEGRSPRQLFLDALELADGPGVAVDLGCGDGTETLALLAGGWTVVAVDSAPEGIARLRASVPASAAGRLTTLPFCHPSDFGEAWRRSAGAVRLGGVFAAHFFGPRDTWAGTSEMTFHTRDEVEALFHGLEIERLDEQEVDGQAFSGPKHWHVFHVIARRKEQARWES